MAKKSIYDFYRMKEKGEKVTYITAYDFYQARLAEEAGIDMILVGDSVARIVYGYPTMLPVTMDQMVVHCQAVRAGAPNTCIIGDMPFLSYEIGVTDAIRNAGRLVKEAGVDVVKPEGGHQVAYLIKAIVDAGMCVQGHIGLTAQRLGPMGGFRPQATTAEGAMEVLADAKAIEEAGATATTIVAVPAEVGKLITESVKMPVYGIAAGPYCDGQVQICTDVLGFTQMFIPRFVKRYANLYEEVGRVYREYVDDVRSGKFPGEEHYDKMEDAEEQRLRALLKKVS